MGRWARLAPLTGFAAVGFFVAETLVAGETPTVDDPVSTMMVYWTDHVRAQEIVTGLMATSAFAFVWFGASVRSALRDMGNSGERLGSIAHAGTVLIAAGLSLYASVGLALVHTVGEVPVSVTQTLTVLSGEDLYLVLAVGTALLVTSTAVGVLRYPGLPQWFGVVSLVLGVIAAVVVFVGALVPGLGYVAWLLLVLWVPTLSTLIYRRQSWDA
jgi:hypothetical protein